MALVVGCGKEKETDVAQSGDKVPVSDSGDLQKVIVPEIGEIRNICQLATMRCYYHNLAKSVKESGSGISHLVEKDRKFWIEYTGIAEISYNIYDISMEQNGSEITITLPDPTIECWIDQDSWNEDSYVIEEDQWLFTNPITAEDQGKAIEATQQNMEETLRNDRGTLMAAEQQAQELIQNYIERIGEAAGVEYHITWKKK